MAITSKITTLTWQIVLYLHFACSRKEQYLSDGRSNCPYVFFRTSYTNMSNVYANVLQIKFRNKSKWSLLFSSSSLPLSFKYSFLKATYDCRGHFAIFQNGLAKCLYHPSICSHILSITQCDTTECGKVLFAFERNIVLLLKHVSMLALIICNTQAGFKLGSSYFFSLCYCCCCCCLAYCVLWTDRPSKARVKSSHRKCHSLRAIMLVFVCAHVGTKYTHAAQCDGQAIANPPH